MIEGFVPIRAISQNIAFQGRRFNTPTKRKYEEAVLLSLGKPTMPPLTGELELELIFYLKSIKRSDLDNFIKISQDLLQKRGFFKNDNQIISLIARKEQADEEGWRFRISELS